MSVHVRTRVCHAPALELQSTDRCRSTKKEKRRTAYLALQIFCDDVIFTLCYLSGHAKQKFINAALQDRILRVPVGVTCSNWLVQLTLSRFSGEKRKKKAALT